MGDRNGSGNRSSNVVTSRIKTMTREIPFFSKIIELILCAITIGLIIDPFKYSNMRPNLDHAGTIFVSICGYILINSIIILCYLIGERQPKRMSMIFSVVGGILSLACGIILINDWNNIKDNLSMRYDNKYKNQIISSGIFAMINSMVFLIDAIFTNKYEF